ncbi:MAG: HD-GYP domain-containing protein, partial [Solirubrobacteraceae bacterium]
LERSTSATLQIGARGAEAMLVGNDTPKMSRYLPQALGATGLVVAGPVVAVWALRGWQVVGSTAVAVAIGVVLSLAVSFAGSAYWASRESSRDVLFSELMIWGWLRRWRAEHQLTAALERLGRVTSTSGGREATPQLSMLKELAVALEAGDPYTRNHSRRVARYASMIAERLGLPAEEVDRIRTAAAVHDVGKVQTPIEVLHKPGRLTDEEYGIIKAHPVDGARLVEALGDERLTAIVRHHHERLDGRGYPDCLRGEEIPLGARIVAVADTFDAITSARPYRPASPHRKALDIIIKEAGTQLDADAVRAFRACYTGRRPFALWTTLLAVPQRVSTTLGTGTTASVVSVTKVAAAASTVAVVGGAAASVRPLMVVPAAPRTAAAASVAAEPQSSGASAASAAVGASRQPAGALAAKLAVSPAQTREQTLLRHPGARSRRFPTAVAHRVSSRSSHAGSPPPVTTSPSSVPAAAPSSSTSPSSSSTAPEPVSTVAAAPTTTTTTTTTETTTTTTAPSGSGSAGTTDTPTKTPGSGGAGHGKGGGHGKKSTPTATTPTTTTPTTTTTTPTTTTTTPTTTTTAPVTDPPGNGHGNGNGNAYGNGNGNGNGNANATSNAGGNGNGNGNAGGNGNGNGHSASVSVQSAG